MGKESGLEWGSIWKGWKKWRVRWIIIVKSINNIRINNNQYHNNNNNNNMIYNNSTQNPTLS